MTSNDNETLEQRINLTKKTSKTVRGLEHYDIEYIGSTPLLDDFARKMLSGESVISVMEKFKGISITVLDWKMKGKQEVIISEESEYGKRLATALKSPVMKESCPTFLYICNNVQNTGQELRMTIKNVRPKMYEMCVCLPRYVKQTGEFDGPVFMCIGFVNPNETFSYTSTPGSHLLLAGILNHGQNCDNKIIIFCHSDHVIEHLYPNSLTVCYEFVAVEFNQ